MKTLVDLFRTVPPEALGFLLLVFLAGMVWLVLALRRRLRQKSANSGWHQLEERVQDLKQRKQD